MKTQFKMNLFATTVALGLSTTLSFAQWNWVPTPAFNRWGQTNNPGGTFNDIKSIVVGDFTGFGAIPRSAFHINSNFLSQTTGGFFYSRGEVFRTDCPSSVTTNWRMLRGGFEVGRLFNLAGTGTFNIQSTLADMRFHTSNGTGLRERMKMTGITVTNDAGTFVNATRVAISYGENTPPITTPVSILHLGYDCPVINVGGQRTWMDVGTLSCRVSDNMYVGIKQNEGLPIDVTMQDAVINWADNGGTTEGPDNLRFIFTAPQSSTHPGAVYNGLEVARMQPDGNVGIGDYSPLSTNVGALAVGARLDIDGDLRIRTVTQDNTLNRVLVIDPTDLNRVHWRNINALGTPCGSANPAQLTADSEIQLNSFDFHFSDQGTVGNQVGIGRNCGALLAKLDVFQNSTNFNTIGIHVQNDDQSTILATPVIGIKSIVIDNNNADLSVAGWFESIHNPGLNGKAIIVPFGGGYVGFQMLNPQYQLDVNGIAHALGHPTSSDERYKTNIDTLENALDLVTQLTGIYYEWDTAAFPNKNFTSGRQLGFIAQDVEPIIPEVVMVNDSGFYTLEYDKFAPVLAEAIKELKAEVDSLKELMEACCQNNNLDARLGHGNQVDESGELNEPIPFKLQGRRVILYDPVPNPNRGSASIGFYIPENTGDVEIIFHDSFGRPIKSARINQRGEGSLAVDARDLANGIYTYSIVVNGEVVDTRRMVRSR